jgi:hypothetical protein
MATKYSMLSRSPTRLETTRDEMKRSCSFIQRPVTVSHVPGEQSGGSEAKLKSSRSSLTNSTFYQMIRRKLKFLKSGSGALAEAGDAGGEDEDSGNDDFVFRNNRKIQRSVTNASSIFQKHSEISEAIQQHANSVSHINTSIKEVS